MLVVKTASWTASRGALQRHEQVGRGWQPVGDAIEVTVGKNGLGWGRGMHGGGRPEAAAAGPTKVEGDGRAPAGVFQLGNVWGYAAKSPPGLALDYTQSTEGWRCVDDPDSRYYNQLLDKFRISMSPDWKSAEVLRRRDGRYELLLEVRHNTQPAEPGAGSCIFVHVWHEARPTIGCTAMALENLRLVLEWLKPGALFVALPEGEYASFRKPWRLP